MYIQSSSKVQKEMKFSNFYHFVDYSAKVIAYQIAHIVDYYILFSTTSPVWLR